MYKLIKYLRLHWWRFTPDSWVGWYYFHRANLIDRWEMWKLWHVKPWEENYRCPVCAGTGRHPKYGDECDHCKGLGQIPRWNETKVSKVFKWIGLRINNKVEKLS